jgi:molybdate/tungstate transport system substrate-binding protein
LPDEINLSNPEMSAKWYDSVSFNIKDSAGKEKTLHTQPLVFYAAVLKNAPNPAAAKRFVAFMQSAEGQKIFSENGYDKPKGHDY